MRPTKIITSTSSGRCCNHLCLGTCLSVCLSVCLSINRITRKALKRSLRNYGLLLWKASIAFWSRSESRWPDDSQFRIAIAPIGEVAEYNFFSSTITKRRLYVLRVIRICLAEVCSRVYWLPLVLLLLLFFLSFFTLGIYDPEGFWKKN